MSASPPRPPTLTARQREILEMIQLAVEESGMPPTRSEICTAFGFRSPTSAEDHLRALAAKGVIELVEGTARGIRLKTGQAPKRASRQLALALPELQQLALPLVGQVAAGAPILAQEHVESTLRLDQSLFLRRPDYLLRVRGLSMRDAGILDGDLLAVQKTDEAHQHQIVVARLGDEVTVKRFVRHRQRIELQAANPDFESIWVGPKDTLTIEGVMVGLLRST